MTPPPVGTRVHIYDSDGDLLGQGVYTGPNPYRPDDPRTYVSFWTPNTDPAHRWGDQLDMGGCSPWYFAEKPGRGTVVPIKGNP